MRTVFKSSMFRVRFETPPTKVILHLWAPQLRSSKKPKRSLARTNNIFIFFSLPIKVAKCRQKDERDH